LLAESILEGLNPEQRRAVEAVDGPLLVLAGAGSGKTRVLTSRIAFLIGVCGIPAESILAVTFTNKAAGEMRDRVEKLLGPTEGSLWISTFHSMCVRILRRDIGALSRSRGFVIYDDADTLGVAKEVLKRHGLDPRAYEPKRLLWRIDDWKNRGLLPAAAAAAARDIDDEQSAELYATYQRLLCDANSTSWSTSTRIRIGSSTTWCGCWPGPTRMSASSETRINRSTRGVERTFETSSTSSGTIRTRTS
jgi:DNA helicase-2/ATP-dependent DNA helicase PcrA